MRIYPHADQPSIAPPAVAQPVPTARLGTLVFIGVVLGALLLSGVGSGLFASSFTASGAPTSPHSSLAISSLVGQFHPSAARTASSNTTHADGAWVRLAPVQPSTPGARVYSSLVYDTVDRSLVLFGGWSPKIGPLGDTWVFSAGSWTNLTSTLSSAPSPRYGAIAVYDPYDGFVLLFGGISSQGTMGDAWTFSHGAWTLLSNSSSTGPAPRSFSGLANDRGSSDVVLFGGADMQGNPLNDTWAYVAGGWKDISTSTGATPPARSNAAMSLDPTTNSIILFGGTGVCGTPCPDTWSLSAGVWTNLTGTLTVSPSARSDATSMYDPVSGSLLLFGGHAPALFNDTWRYSVSGWTNLTLSLSTAPAPSYGSAAAFDPADGYAVVVGGRTPNGLRAAVWAFIEPLGARLLVSSPIVAPGSSVIFTSTIVGGVGPYRTLIDPGDGTIPAYATVLTHTYSTAGNYSATVSTTDARGVGARIALNISVVAYPLHVSLMVHPAVATPRQPLTLTAFVTGGTAPYTFSWSGLPSPCLSANLASLSCSPQNIGSYAVTVTVTDAGNAKSTAVSNFTVTPLSASTSGPFVPSVGGSLISRVGWNIVPAIIAAMGMSAVAAFLMYREAKSPAPEPAALPERPMCYIPPEWSETPDEFT